MTCKTPKRNPLLLNLLDLPVKATEKDPVLTAEMTVKLRSTKREGN